LLLEHTRSPNAALGFYQDVTREPVRAMGKGCVWNQRVPDLLVSAGLIATSIEYGLLGTVVTIEAVKS
jgi:methyltransferase OMS1, mitochondrial